MAGNSEKSIFLAALDQPSPEDRRKFLAGACAGDQRLYKEVSDLLQAHDAEDNLLDRVPPGAEESKRDRKRYSGDTVDYAPGDDSTGKVIGAYKLIEQIGEGGFGLVYVAEQQQPVRRKVALKIIKPGMDTRDIIARFEAERQALAMMDHPNIARVFDAGATDAGRPYFVMELVRGVPINQFCDRNALTPQERLTLFVNVCHAVQHAHQKGIIHRDLKPSNVLVTLHDGVPVPKVIDFGVAKAIGQVLTDKTIYTRFTQMIGTPLYMSPEQAEMSGLDIDTRSDIYSLGVLLYELLTGTTPADPKRLDSASFDEVRRIIREEEPPRPSTRLTTMGMALSTISTQRHTEPRKLSAMLRGDLDWIVMKALEKDRRRRYETAGGLANDIERYLQRQPVEARPPSAWYRFQKLAARHKVGISTAALVLAALVLGTVVSTWQAMRARSAELQAIAERDKKENALADAERLRAAAENRAASFKEVNQLLARARTNADSDRLSAALADYSLATERMPDLYLVWTERASFYLRNGLWTLAAADYAKALDLGALSATPALVGVPELFLYVGDDVRYRQVCDEMIKLVENGSAGRTAMTLIRGCVVGPISEKSAASLVAVAEAGEFGPGPPGANLFTLALANYRAGQYEAAEEYLDELIQDTRWPGWPLAYPVLAMNYSKLGEQEKATEALELAVKAQEIWKQSDSSEFNFLEFGGAMNGGEPGPPPDKGPKRDPRKDGGPRDHHGPGDRGPGGHGPGEHGPKDHGPGGRGPGHGHGPMGHFGTPWFDKIDGWLLLREATRVVTGKTSADDADAQAREAAALEAIKSD